MIRIALVIGALAVLAVGAFAIIDGGGEDDGSGSASAETASDASVCNYYFEWLDRVRFPLQADPHAAYSYVIPEITDDPVALEITGQFPFAAWTSWTIYTAR